MSLRVSTTTDRILIVEDDPVVAEVLAATCRAAGMEVTVELDSTRALGHLAGPPPDLILLDLFLGTMNGLELLDAIRADPRLADTAVVVLSSTPEVADRVQALRRGASDFLAKPFDPEELMVRIERLRRRSPQGQLTGQFENYPVSELLQYLANGQHSGELAFGVRVRPARLRLQRGRVVAAEFGLRRGVEAVWALLETVEGTFSFQAAPPDEVESASEGLAVQGLLIESAWVEDELGRRRSSVPPHDQPLQAVESATPLDSECAGLPHAELIAFFQAAPGRTLGQALELLPQAPSRLEFAAACLVDAGKLRLAGAEARESVTRAATDGAPRTKLALFYPQSAEDEVFAWVATAVTPPGESPLRTAPWRVQVGSTPLELLPRALALAEVDTIFSEASQAAGVILWLPGDPASLVIPPRLLQAAARGGWLVLVNATDRTSAEVEALLGRASRWHIVDRDAGRLGFDFEGLGLEPGAP